ncbi:MAG: Aminoacylase [Actinomycetia bacterium]|nr:Aminoacylase [Actinomycetes bacterium]
MYDVIIRGGEVVDGTGGPRRRADVGIRDGKIVAIGEVTGEAASVVDATGKVVAPGFVDVHTHFVAQVFWDGALTPSPLHGVTTVLAGNCGFTIAPLSADPADGDYLMRMLARVEGMPLESLRDGVPWSWRTTPEYFDAIDGKLGVNAGFMVGHSAIRRVVMGTEANQRTSTDEELAAMKRLLHEGLEAGGLGFSSSWARTHNDAEGHMVPSRYATTDELFALAGVAGEHEGTSLEFIPMVGPRFEPWAVDLMVGMSVAAQRPLNWNILTVTAGNAEDGRAKLEAGDVARERGGKVVALTIPHSFGVRLSFASGFVLDAVPGWEEAMLLPRDEKLALFRDKAARDALNDKAQAPGNPMGTLCNWSTKVIYDVVAPENKQYEGRTVGEIAAEQGRDPWDTLVDIVLADELLTSFGTEAVPASDDDWKARVGFWRDSRAVIGASDAGAHLDLLASFNYATVLLGEAVRERQALSLEEAIHLITDVPAQLYGLVDRGRLQEGWNADVVVLDPATVQSDTVAMRFDLPGGAGRLYAGAKGIEHVLVNGEAIVRDGVLTESRSGTLLRSGRDTRTPSLG